MTVAHFVFLAVAFIGAIVVIALTERQAHRRYAPLNNRPVEEDQIVEYLERRR